MAAVHQLAKLDESGDLKTLWSPDKPDEVAAARKMFDDLRAKGYTIFRVGKNGKQSEVMHSFDPDAEALIAAPRVVGG